MKKLLYWSAATLALMIAGPWLALLAGGMDAMGLCFLLFFAVNPLFSLICGVFAGRDIKQLWSLPIIVAGFFVAGVWIHFEMGEPAFLLYAGCYLVIGVLAMLIGAWVKRK